MNQITKVGITLALIAALAATSLALVNALTEPKIAAYEKSVIANALLEVAGGYALGDTLSTPTTEHISSVQTLLDEGGALVGYILQIDGVGYGGAMNVMSSYTTDGTIIDAQLLANSETPGLGKKAEESSYMDKFREKGGKTPIPLKKDQLNKEQADSVGGSTVTFNGVAKALSWGSEFVKGLGEE